jgi:hypothetical protein
MFDACFLKQHIPCADSSTMRSLCLQVKHPSLSSLPAEHGQVLALRKLKMEIPIAPRDEVEDTTPATPLSLSWRSPLDICS